MTELSSSETRTYCRTCQACCGMIATVEGGRLTKVRGDRADPMSMGYACFKGLQAPDYHYDPQRLLRPLVRLNGRLEACSTDDALAVAGDRLAAIVERHGGAAVGLYMGTQSLFATPVQPLMRAIAAALGTPRLFATMTIDQSAKWIAEARLGSWHAGPQDFAGADVWMLVGANPAVSMVMAGGATHIACPNPIKTLRKAKARGLKLIVIDPRRSETAAFADLFLQPRPGTDAFIAAALLQVVLREGWCDRDFCDTHVEGLSALAIALAALSPERTAEVTGLAADEVRRAAALFARDSRRGMVGTGTGTDMGPHSNVAEQLFQTLNVVCGRFPRAGEPVPNPGVLAPKIERHAEVSRIPREWDSGPRTLRHGLGPIRGTMMSTAITDEILADDPARMRALICVGGNPAFALPDADRTFAALEALELLIVIDPRLTATARRAHVVFAPTLQYERPDHTGVLERLFQRPYAHATAALVQPPPGSDVLDDGTILLSLAQHLNLDVRLDSVPVTGADTGELLAILAKHGSLTLGDLQDHSGGLLHAPRDQLVHPPISQARFDVLAPDVAEEIAALASEPLVRDEEECGLRLIVRRHREVMNTAGTDLPATAERFRGNTAFVNAAVLDRLGLQEGDDIVVQRGDAFITAHVARDDAVAVGCMSLAHCWARSANTEDATNRLVDANWRVQAINRMPVMTGIQVRIASLKSEV